jgi:hypothetical protein
MITPTEFKTVRELIENYKASLTKQDKENIQKLRMEAERHQALQDGLVFEDFSQFN